MRTAVVTAVLLATAACSSEPSFDERYAAAKKHVEGNSRAIDAELKAKASTAAGTPSDAPVIEVGEVTDGDT